MPTKQMEELIPVTLRCSASSVSPAAVGAAVGVPTERAGTPTRGRTSARRRHQPSGCHPKGATPSRQCYRSTQSWAALPSRRGVQRPGVPTPTALSSKFNAAICWHRSNATAALPQPRRDAPPPASAPARAALLNPAVRGWKHPTRAASAFKKLENVCIFTAFSLLPSTKQSGFATPKQCRRVGISIKSSRFHEKY